MNKFQLGAKQAVEVCAGVKSDDRVFLLQDDSSEPTAKLIEEAITKASRNFLVQKIRDFQRPFRITPEILKIAQNVDEVFVCLSYIREELSIFWVPLAGIVKKSPVKLLVLIGIEKRMLAEGMGADYHKIRQFSKKVFRLVKNAQKIRVKTKIGSDFVVELGFKWMVLDGFPQPGKWVNLPDGEVLTTPTNLNGKVVIDGSIEEFDNLRFKLLKKNPISVEFKNGYATKGSVYSCNKELENYLNDNIFTHDENSCRVGEFAFGTNTYLKKLIGNITQDEKFPSVHIAFGDPHGEMTGACWTSPVHMDAIILEPTVWADDKMIMRQGEYLI